MYFWHIEDLKKDLVAGPLNDREVLPYLLIFVGLSALVLIFPAESMNPWDYALAISTLLITVGGTVYVYYCNGAAAGSHFVQRYLAIGWVVTVRWGVAVIFAFVVLLFLIDTSGDETTPITAVFWITAEVALYERIGHHIRAVTSTKPLRSVSRSEMEVNLGDDR
jgi:hypothetical protein